MHALVEIPDETIESAHKEEQIVVALVSVYPQDPDRGIVQCGTLRPETAALLRRYFRGDGVEITFTEVIDDE